MSASTNLMNAVANVQMEFEVTPSQAKLLLLLAAKPAVTTENVVAAGIKTPARMAVLKLRRRLYETSPEISVEHRVGVGWYVTEEVKARIVAAAKRSTKVIDKRIGEIIGAEGHE